MLQQLQTEKIIHNQGGARLRETTNKAPLVSIVCVTFNAAHDLPSLIKSIRANKPDVAEFVVVDGKSIDGTINILEKNEDIIDFWISKPDGGIYDAMNRAINYVKGKWVIFLGADDLLLPDFCKIPPLLKNTNTIYYGNLLFHGKEFLKVYNDYYLTKLNICQQAIFYPKAVFNKYTFDLRYSVYADYHLNLRCWHDPQFNFVHTGCMVSYFSDGGFSSYTKDPVFERHRDTLFKTYLKPISYYRYLNRSLGFLGMFTRLIQNK